MKKALSYCGAVLLGAALFHFIVGRFVRFSYPLEPKWYALPVDIPLWIAEARGNDFAWDTRAGYTAWALECLLFGLLFRAAVVWGGGKRGQVDNVIMEAARNAFPDAA